MSDKKAGLNSWESRVNKNTVRLGYWTGAWLITMALASFGPKLLWAGDDTMSILAIAINIGAGFGMILANKNHLKGLDEMQQKITLEAMALSLGVGLVAGLSYSLLDTSNLISFDAEISHMVIVMGLTYLLAILAGHRHYR